MLTIALVREPLLRSYGDQAARRLSGVSWANPPNRRAPADRGARADHLAGFTWHDAVRFGGGAGRECLRRLPGLPGSRCHPALQARLPPIRTRRSRDFRTPVAFARRTRAVGGVPGRPLGSNDRDAIRV